MVNTLALKTARMRQGVMQKDVATALDIGQSIYSLKENGKRRITLEEASVIARILGLTGDEVLSIFFCDEVFSKYKYNPKDAHGDTTQSHVDGDNLCVSDAGKEAIR